MYRYLGRNQTGYDSSRTYSIDNEFFPALLFDPHPNGFVIPKYISQNTWSISTNVKLPTNREDIAFYSILQQAALLKSRQITALELTQLYLNRIKRHDVTLLSVNTITEERALAQARKVDAEIAAGKPQALVSNG